MENIEDEWERRIERLVMLDRRLRLLEANVDVLEERLAALRANQEPRPRLQLVQ